MISFLFTLTCTWLAFCIIDLIFKTCMLLPYIQALEMSGLIIKPFYLKCYLRIFNRRFSKWANMFPKFFSKWFDVGAVVTCIFILPALGLLIFSAIKLIVISKPEEVDAQILQPVVPGYNLPFSQIFYYLITIFFCSVFHEIGHAIAAAREGIPIEGCGFFVFFILPAAFVDLKQEQLFSSSWWQQLRVFSAGIWHNFVLVFMSLCLLWFNPLLFSPLYYQNQGISIINIEKNSGHSGPAGLVPLDHIQSVNNCSTNSLDNWKACLQEIALNTPNGFCVSKVFLEKYPITYNHVNENDCCSNSSSHLCFQMKYNLRQALVCLPVRKTLTSHKLEICYSNDECVDHTKVCITPMLSSHSERLIIINRFPKDPVLYLGSASELFASVTVSPWLPKINFLSVHLIHVYETFLKYVISFSSALALLNLIPCPGLDGQWICSTLTHKLFYKQTTKTLVLFFLKLFGTLLIFTNVILGLYKLFYLK